MKKIQRLSKSQYLKGIQCPKALWLYRHRKDLIPEVTAAKQALFDTGHEVGRIAQQYFDNGVEIDVPYYLIDKAIATTRQAIKVGNTTLFEASAGSPDGAYSRIDILEKVRGGHRWDLIEVKASTQVKDYHIDDMALQRYAFTGGGYDVRNSVLMHIDNQYVRRGDLEPRQMFVLADSTQAVGGRMTTVSDELKELLVQVNRAEEPDIAIGGHCRKPFECDFMGYCWRHVPEYSVYDLFSGQKLAALLSMDITRIEEVPPEFSVTDRQARLVRAHKSGQYHVDKQGVRAFIDRLEYPLYLLDYETIFPAVPMFDNSRPYQQVPFQFSLHIQPEKRDEPQHVEYLHTDKGDPRPQLVEQMVQAFGRKGSVVVYNQSFEEGINNHLADLFPEHREQIHDINARMVDLLAPFQSLSVYHPDMNGSASLKSVLPVLVPEMSYDDMTIGDGGEASRAYLSWLKGEIPEDERQSLFADLREYCEQDTLAEVRLIEVLESFV